MDYNYKVTFKVNENIIKREFNLYSDVLRFIDEYIDDDYLYDIVFDWLSESRYSGDFFQKGNFSIFLADKN